MPGPGGIVAGLTGLETEKDADTDTSGTQANADVTASRRTTGLLNLPPEVMQTILRHILVYPHRLPLATLPRSAQPPANILRTNRLIYQQAFDILYRENHFSDVFESNSLWPRSYSLAQFPRVMRTMQSIQLDIYMSARYFQLDIYMSARYFQLDSFLKLLLHFGAPDTVRRKLTLRILLDHLTIGPLKCFVHAMGRFTNFRTIELLVDRFGFRERVVIGMRDQLAVALQPLLGSAERFFHKEDYVGCEGLRFHPTDRQSRLRANEGDWVDTVNRLRLEWNGDVLRPGTLLKRPC
ncbi:hypothetical protein MMC07_004061 [Pseudocyphellaria aurata]|nr:hypothetical protein [Pseudocyphellaria aurata]